MTKPAIMSTNKPLHFGDLSPLEFERLCLWLVEREGYLRPQHLGEAGGEQGRDIVAYKPTDEGEELWYFQCKRYKRIDAPTLKREVDNYNALSTEDPSKRPVGVIFVTSGAVSARIRDRVAAYCQEHGYACEFWARTELDMWVKKHPDIVMEFFHAQSYPTQITPPVGTEQQPPVSHPRAVSRLDIKNVRRKLNQILDDTELETFCMENFPEVYDKFSRGLRKDEKVNLLLDHCRRTPARYQRLISTLTND